MFRRVCVPLVTAAGVIPITMKIHAADVDDKQETKTFKGIRPSQLPVYGEPPKTEYEFIPEKETKYFTAVSSFRHGVWDVLDKFKDTTEKAKDKLGIAKTHSADLLTYIQEDAGFVPRAVIITVAGLGGIVAGYKGRILKKSFFAGIGMITAASICYPQQAVDITSTTWDTIKLETKSRMRQTLGGKKREDAGAPNISHKVDDESNKDKLTEAASSEPVTEKGKDQLTTVQASTDDAAAKKTEKDYGQSKAEDKDMYTTRGS